MSGWPVFWEKGQKPPLWALLLSFVYCMLVALKRQCYRWRICRQYHAPVPVVIVGNRVVGGTGKTPVMIGLVRLCQKLGFEVGIVSRGYGRDTRDARLVDPSSSSHDVGDEPLLLWQTLGVPVAVSVQRAEAVKLLLSAYPCNLILSDDGWQHWSLARNAVVEVVDAQRGYGNGYCLPAGPLRESADSDSVADVVLYNGVDFHLSPQCWRHIASGVVYDVGHIKGTVIAMAGIGNPQRFFNTLISFGVSPIKKISLADHQRLSLDDFSWDDGSYPVVMTAKDAVRCQRFAKDHWWSLEVETVFSDNTSVQLQNLIRKLEQKEIKRG